MRYFRPLPTLETKRLLLRRAFLTDTDDLFICMKNENVCRYEVWFPHKTKLETLGFVNSLITKYDDEECTEWVIERKSDRRVIGVINLHDFIGINGYAEMGFWFGEEYWGKGYGEESSKAVLKFVFNTLKLNRLVCMCCEENFASRILLEKLHMTYEGTLRKHIKIKKEFADIRVYSIIESDNFYILP